MAGISDVIISCTPEIIPPSQPLPFVFIVLLLCYGKNIKRSAVSIFVLFIHTQITLQANGKPPAHHHHHLSPHKMKSPWRIIAVVCVAVVLADDTAVCPPLPDALARGDGDVTETTLYVHSLPEGCIRMPPTGFIARLPTAVLNQLAARQVGLLSVESVRGLTPEQCKGFLLQGLSGEQCAGLTVECLSTSQHVDRLQAGCISFVREDVVALLGRAVLQGLRPEVWAGLTVRAVGVLGPDQCQHIPARSVAYVRSCRMVAQRCLVALPVEGVAELRPACVRMIPPIALAGQQPAFYSALSIAAAAAMTSAQLAGLVAECAYLPPEVLPLLTAQQCSNLTSDCFATLRSRFAGVCGSASASASSSVSIPEAESVPLKREVPRTITVKKVEVGGGGGGGVSEARLASLAQARQVEKDRYHANNSVGPIFLIFFGLFVSVSLFMVKQWIDDPRQKKLTQVRRF